MWGVYVGVCYGIHLPICICAYWLKTQNIVPINLQNIFSTLDLGSKNCIGKRKCVLEGVIISFKKKLLAFRSHSFRRAFKKKSTTDPVGNNFRNFAAEDL